MNPGEPSTIISKRRPFIPSDDYGLKSELPFSYHKRTKNTNDSEIHNKQVLPPSPKTPNTDRAIYFNPPERASSEYDRMSRSQLPSPERESHMSNVDSAASYKSQKTYSELHDLPPRDVPTLQYIQHVPASTSQTFRMRQLLLWFMQKELENDKILPVKNPDSLTAAVKKKLMEEFHTSGSLVSQHKQPDVVAPREVKQSALFVKNSEQLVKIHSAIEDLKALLADWDRCTDDVYDAHASAMDAIGDQEANDFKEDYDDTFINKLELFQRETVLNLLNTTVEETTREFVANIEAKVTQFRDILNTTYQFQKYTGELLSKRKAILAYKLREIARVVPIDADKRILGLYEDTKEKRRQNEFQNLEAIFRLTSQYESKNNFVREDSDMELD